MKSQDFWIIVLSTAIFFSLFAFSAACGDGTCEAGENSCSCQEDCGTCSGEVSGKTCSAYYCTEANICAIEIIPNCCGNDWCEISGNYSEDFGNCASDCEPKVVNLTVVSPQENYKARYGEELFFKVIADADGRSIAGIKIKVTGPFETFTLFNDGQHDDNGFNDNIFGAYTSVPNNTTPGIWEVDFNTTFREVDGNNSIMLEVFPFVETEIETLGEVELGNNIKINGKLFINENPVTAKIEASLINDKNELIVSENLTTNETGLFEFEYRTTFVNKPGNWVFSIIGKDEYGNVVNESRKIEVFNAGETPEKKIELLKQLKEEYSGNETIEIALKIEEQGNPLEEANVIIEAFGAKQELHQIGIGEYAGSIKVPTRINEKKSELKVKVFNQNGGQIAEESFFFTVNAGELNVDFIFPDKKLFQTGEKIIFKILATYADGTLLDAGKAFVLLNSKKLMLEQESQGVFSAEYIFGKEDQGSIEISAIVEGNGAEGSAKKTIAVSGFSEFYTEKEDSQGIILIILIIIGGAIIIGFYLKKQSLKASKKERLKELDNLEKNAQKMYFHEKSINKEEYNKFMEKYKKQKKELENQVK
ncbi:MAG: hypothetical protein NUV57_04320 [archaeon]|nr:hypothetical protein [archaeon]